MHADEYRDLDSIRRLRLAEAIKDSDSISNQSEPRSGLTQGSSLKQLKAERDELERQVRSARVALEELQSENNRLNNQRALAEQRLKSVRESRTFLVGKAATAPFQAVRRAINDPRLKSMRIDEKLKTSLRKSRYILRESRERLEKSSVGSGDYFKSRTENSDLDGVPTDISVDSRANRGEGSSPVDIYEKKPSVRTFERAMKHLWFTEGKLLSAKAFIENSPQYVEKLGDISKSLANRILGEARIDPSQIVPERSPYPAYVAEPGRIMYCVHQSPVYNSNGYSTRTRGVASGLNAGAGDVVVVARSGYPWDSSVDIEKPKSVRSVSILDGVQYVHLPGGNLNRDPIDQYVLQCADAFVREARMIRPSIIQSASNYKTALPALIAARRLGIPFVYEVRGFWEITEASANSGFQETERFESMRSLETFVAQNADRLLAITSQVRDELIVRGIDPEIVEVSPNSVDPEIFLPLPKDIEYSQSKGIRIDAPVIGFAGSIVGYEGLDLLVEASRLLSTKGVDHQVVIAGSGAAEQDLKEQVTKLALDSQVLLLGRLPQDEMPRLHSTFDIVVCPRRANLVTELVSPLKPLESFATGKATVLSNVAPNRDLAGEDEERALLCDADDAASLARQLEKLILNADLRADFGRTARLWVVSERSWASLGKSMLDAHKHALEDAEKKILGAKPLHTLRVGVIGDEFTRSALEDAFNVEWLSRKNWESQLDSAPNFDLIFVESAWEGNGGEWWRGVGHYSDEESTDLRSLLAVAREKDIPSVFWNKEDPIHFSRFAPNAAFFDHVFTTDANMIPRYINAQDSYNKTVSALPFFAQPKLHNPMPSTREFRETVAYAGSYYGDRFKERSEALERLLAASVQYGLDIYDRQANNPDSSYKFPQIYRSAVRGGLQYRETVESYKSHIAHLNVNSVFDSPTMFSRRVVEIPACGGIVMSAKGRGITETLGSNIAHSDDPEDHRAWLHGWTTNPVERLEEIWRQMRTVYRSHTTETALSILARTAGISVEGIKPVEYTAVLEDLAMLSPAERLKHIEHVASQSVRPRSVKISDLGEEEAAFVKKYGIQVMLVDDFSASHDIEVHFPKRFSRTFAEDVLLPLRFGEFSSIFVRSKQHYENISPVLEPTFSEKPREQLLAVNNRQSTAVASVIIELPGVSEQSESAPSLETEITDIEGKTVLVAGHDLKFAEPIIEKLHGSGCKVLIDKWEGHNRHDSYQSKVLLGQADIVFCEWGLGNAVWYSKNLHAHQSLVIRVHSQELFLPFLKQIRQSSVSKFIFVGELVRKAAIESHGILGEKSVVIPNFVDTSKFAKPKDDTARKTLGIVGIVPRSKRIDRALDVLEGLLEQDPTYKLRIKGKVPEDYPWLRKRPDEMDFYSNQYSRIISLNEKWPGAVIFDSFGHDMEEWYRLVGIVLSTSDFESFHLTLADGASSGAMPVSLNWPGADLIYPLSWLFATTEDMVNSILNQTFNVQDAQKFVEINFKQSDLLNRFVKLLVIGHRERGTSARNP
ncbi:glycosyltransferase [Corynebacterium ammoniagenes]|uniref:Glycosyltransferase, group 1 family protein n=1 Tax=Corynebacterium ammoniagenes DSM 20306 TaxID=649754 RepID=A0ABP2I9S5_CORAM|nr:glycosyltransferase [Corynebacterium ammoniagenes]AQS73278.1 glycosyl transferase family 1 [Corynebacterium ammoniagenes]EFG80256.1 glycosyltransferase, group 1 family protein [Corynebacterium ammoniagenes DSM 20306]